MYGYIYRISFPTSSGIKYYYGKHKFSSEDNYYYGSSKIGQNWLKSKIKNYKLNRLHPKIAEKLGIKKFILCYCETEEDLNLTEKYIISLHKGKDYCWNISNGGNGGNTGNGWNNWSKEKQLSVINKIRNSLTGHKVSRETKEKISQTKLNVISKYSLEERKLKFGKSKGKPNWRKGIYNSYYKCLETGEIKSSSDWAKQKILAYRGYTKKLHFEKVEM